MGLDAGQLAPQRLDLDLDLAQLVGQLPVVGGERFGIAPRPGHLFPQVGHPALDFLGASLGHGGPLLHAQQGGAPAWPRAEPQPPIVAPWPAPARIRLSAYISPSCQTARIRLSRHASLVYRRTSLRDKTTGKPASALDFWPGNIKNASFAATLKASDTAQNTRLSAYIWPLIHRKCGRFVYRRTNTRLSLYMVLVYRRTCYLEKSLRDKDLRSLIHSVTRARVLTPFYLTF